MNILFVVSGSSVDITTVWS